MFADKSDRVNNSSLSLDKSARAKKAGAASGVLSAALRLARNQGLKFTAVGVLVDPEAGNALLQNG
jgi:hypothetical protein